MRQRPGRRSCASGQGGDPAPAAREAILGPRPGRRSCARGQGGDPAPAAREAIAAATGAEGDQPRVAEPGCPAPGRAQPAPPPPGRRCSGSPRARAGQLAVLATAVLAMGCSAAAAPPEPRAAARAAGAVRGPAPRGIPTSCDSARSPASWRPPPRGARRTSSPTSRAWRRPGARAWRRAWPPTSRAWRRPGARAWPGRPSRAAGGSGWGQPARISTAKSPEVAPRRGLGRQLPGRRPVGRRAWRYADGGECEAAAPGG
jgi:hypothetical protein